jgi:hypothetical protein
VLPDYPEIKKVIYDLYISRMKKIMMQAPFDEVPKHTILEGHQNSITRHDNTIDETEFKEISFNISIDLLDYEKTSIEDILEKVDNCAIEMAKQHSQHFFSVIEKTVEAVGNTVECQIDSFGPEQIFEMLSKVEISFNKDGSPNLPTAIGNYETAKKFSETLKMIEDAPELKKQMDILIERKRSEWRDRESSRKLVG